MKHDDIQQINQILLDAVLSGDRAAALRFVKLSEGLVYAALRKYSTLNSDEMEDLFQQVYLKLFDDNMRRIRQWNGKSSFYSYLYTIVVNIVHDHFKSAAYRQSQSAEEDDEDGNPAVDGLISAMGIRDEVSLQYYLQQLSKHELDILQLYYFEDLKEREIAEKLDLPINTVSSSKNRILKKLRKLMEENP